MRRYKSVRFLTLGMALGAVSSSGLLAEDTKGKWQFGFGLSYFSTTDYIRSNSDIAFTDRVVGDDPGLPPVQSVDERPDINVLNEPSITDDFKIDFNASYGLTRWLAVELSAGFLKAPVGNIEYFHKDQTRSLTGSPAQSPNTNCGPDQNAPCYEYTPQVPFDVKSNQFLPVGTLREIPIQLSAVARFRPESPLDPYIGMGIGYIMTDLKTDAVFKERSVEIDELFVSSADKGDFTRSTRPSTNCDTNGDGSFSDPCTNFSPGPITADVRNAFQWHAVGGIDYYVNERFSFYVDARYVWTSGGVEIKTDGFPQVQLTIADDGQLLMLRRGSDDSPTTWYLWEDVGVRPAGAGAPYGEGDGLYATEDKFGGLQNTTLEVAQGEDDGILLLLPPNTRDLAEAVDQFGYDAMGNQTSVGADGLADYLFCPECAGNGILETEDRNGNTFMDTHLLYGIDICTFGDMEFTGLDGQTKRAADNPKCYTTDLDGNVVPNITNTQNHLWPQGCAPTAAQVSLDFQNLNDKKNVGCPAFPGTAPHSTTETDNAADVFIIQGGKIKLGGFSLGFGFKFLF